MTFSAGYKIHGLVLMILTFSALVLYGNSLQNGFHYDDSHYIVGNPNIRSISPVPRFFTDTQTLSGRMSGHYRPLVVLSYAMNYKVGGLNPVGYRLVNLTFHIGSAFLVFLIVKNMASGLGAGVAASLIFLTHPFSSEVVNYITARSSGMCAFFYLLAFWCWIKYRGGGMRGGGVFLHGLFFLFPPRVAE